MCNFKSNSGQTATLPPVAQIDGRAVLQPAGNRVPDTSSPVKKSLQKSLQKSLSLPSTFNDSTSNEIHTNPTEQRLAAAMMPPKPVSSTKTKKQSHHVPVSIDVAGSIAAAQRVQTAIVQAQRKMRIAHYGRTKSMVERKSASVVDATIYETAGCQDEKRCSFITNYSDPIYVAYHDEEWGVPEHDDKMLFELLALSGAQVGSDWTAILKKREDFRHAFAGFDAELVSKFTEKQMALISTEHGLDLAKVHGVVDNAKRILEVKRDFGSFDKYLWGFVNYKPLAPNYKFGRKIPVKTSKSESISKDMVRRGFRLVGPTVIHSLMQATGLTNDHLISCTRHRFCSAATSSSY